MSDGFSFDVAGGFKFRTTKSSTVAPNERLELQESLTTVSIMTIPQELKEKLYKKIADREIVFDGGLTSKEAKELTSENVIKILEESEINPFEKFLKVKDDPSRRDFKHYGLTKKEFEKKAQELEKAKNEYSSKCGGKKSINNNPYLMSDDAVVSIDKQGNIVFKKDGVTGKNYEDLQANIIKANAEKVEKEAKNLEQSKTSYLADYKKANGGEEANKDLIFDKLNVDVTVDAKGVPTYIDKATKLAGKSYEDLKAKIDDANTNQVIEKFDKAEKDYLEAYKKANPKADIKEGDPLPDGVKMSTKDGKVIFTDKTGKITGESYSDLQKNIETANKEKKKTDIKAKNDAYNEYLAKRAKSESFKKLYCADNGKIDDKKVQSCAIIQKGETIWGRAKTLLISNGIKEPTTAQIAKLTNDLLIINGISYGQIYYPGTELKGPIDFSIYK